MTATAVASCPCIPDEVFCAWSGCINKLTWLPYATEWNPPMKFSAYATGFRTLPLLRVQMGYSLLCGLWVWRRTNRRPCHLLLSDPSTSPRTTRPDGSGRWDNRMAAQHLPRYLGGLAVDKRRTRWNERGPANFQFFFFPAETLSNAWMLQF